MMVWQDHHLNEWSVSIQLALAAGADLSIPSLGAPDPFSLADPATTERVLETAGFAETGFTAVHEPVYYGPDVAAALDWVRGFSCVKDVLHRLDRVSMERAREQLIQTLAAHARGDGVWFDSSAWIVTARRRSPRNYSVILGMESRVMMQIRAHATKEKSGSAEPFSYERAVGSHAVLVRITHCSIARGDVQFMDNEWDDARFPLASPRFWVEPVVVAGCSKAARGRQSTAAARRKLTLTLLMPKHEQGIDQRRAAHHQRVVPLGTEDRLIQRWSKLATPIEHR